MDGGLQKGVGQLNHNYVACYKYAERLVQTNNAVVGGVGVTVGPLIVWLTDKCLLSQQVGILAESKFCNAQQCQSLFSSKMLCV